MLHVKHGGSRIVVAVCFNHVMLIEAAAVGAQVV